MRYILAIGEDEFGPIVTNPLGSTIIYDTLEDAGDAAKSILRNHSREMPPEWGVFVLKLKPAAFYLPIRGQRNAEADPDPELYIDETLVDSEETNDAN